MSFFIAGSRVGDGGDLGGLAGADAHCTALASAAGSDKREWRAYLSATGLDARDRIGIGPWFNARGVQVAASLDELHGDAAGVRQNTALTERGEVVTGYLHDILTGSRPDGTLAEGFTCRDWTSTQGVAMLGHHNRTGGGDRPNSWNSAHQSRGCSLPALESTSGDARVYCFATD